MNLGLGGNKLIKLQESMFILKSSETLGLENIGLINLLKSISKFKLLKNLSSRNIFKNFG